LLALVCVEGLLVFNSLLLRVVEGQHVPHRDVWLFFGATNCLPLDCLVDIVLVLGVGPALCVCGFARTLRKVVLVLPRCYSLLQTAVKGLAHLAQDVRRR
jgi:hypothetical protein